MPQVAALGLDLLHFVSECCAGRVASTPHTVLARHLLLLCCCLADVIDCNVCIALVGLVAAEFKVYFKSN
jgi:hypothetical protein